ncbi:hypothetical protein [Actinocrispum wychmicini]|uniref:DUF308 domain-containing protein n=1 Tax=Actinocrispum wychmicini TaxID=1213861 RepID=A0A4R2IYP6_9PSEU|nr:hypothetical protein [Actinocrispum wychmicini]TCO48095.1 hypothetical protein EV192_116148 [Actinocrispum wychmicini]
MDEEESGALRTLLDAVMKGGSDGPEDVDAAFAQIVANLEREGVGSGVPTDLSDLPELSELTEMPGESKETAPPETPEPATPPPTAGWRGHETEMDWSWSTDDDHYVPPEPPPLPKPSALTVVALVLMLIALFLLVAPGVIGLSTPIATPIALISAAVGIGLVVLRIRQNNPPGSDNDNGAQI